MSRKTALIDFDGTLVDSMPYWYSLPMMTRSGERPPELTGYPDPVRSRPLWEPAEYSASFRPADTLEELGLLRDKMMRDHYRYDISLKEGALSLLRLFRECGMSVVLFSATRRYLLLPAVEHFGLNELLDAVITEGEIGTKHEPETYNALAVRFGCRPSDMLLVEDTLPNLRAAKSLGLATVGVYDHSQRERWPVLSAEADVCLPSFADLGPLRALLS